MFNELCQIVAVYTPKANVQCTTAGGKALKSARNRHQTDMLMNTLYERTLTNVNEIAVSAYNAFTIE